MTPTDPNAPVEIARFLDIRQAQLALSVLNGSGIEGYLDQPYTGSIAPHYMLGSGGIRLFVRPEDAHRATLLLNIPERPADEG